MLIYEDCVWILKSVFEVYKKVFVWDLYEQINVSYKGDVLVSYEGYQWEIYTKGINKLNKCYEDGP